MKRASLFLCLVALSVTACGSQAVISSPARPSPASPSTGPTRTVASTVSLAPTADQPADRSVEVSRRARAHIESLTSIGPRVAGSQAEGQAAAYISIALGALGYQPQIRPFVATSWSHRQITSANVVAVKPGASPRQIVVGAHYDSVSKGLGADDNASGVAVMLEVAELLADEFTPYTVCFVAFGAEEVGFLGSAAFVAGMSEEERANTLLMVNLDSVVAGNFQYVYSEEGSSAARDWVLTWASAHGRDLRTVHDIVFNDPHGNGFSDYAPFLAAGIPFVYFEATDWTLGDKDGWTQVDTTLADRGVIRHTGYDTLAWLDATFPGRVDARLELTVAALYAFLTTYEE